MYSTITLIRTGFANPWSLCSCNGAFNSSFATRSWS